MRKAIVLLIIVSGLVSCNSFIKYPGGESLINRNQDFNLGWKFVRDSIIGAETINFNDSVWRTVDLPHDWSIEDLPLKKGDTIVGPFSKKSIGATSTGYAVGGTGWYRKTFTLGSEDSSKNISIQFDGVYMESDLWVNGRHACSHSYGYTPFSYDITSYLNKPGIANVLAVRVKNTGRNSRWYSGSGIYRNVWLIKTNNLHLENDGIAITSPKVSDENASVKIEIKVKNIKQTKGNIRILTSISNPHGKMIRQVESNVPAVEGNSSRIGQEISINKPELWNCESPKLYKAAIELVLNHKIVDRQVIAFGIRSIGYREEKGFLLNGKSIKLKGACMHHDNGLLGAAAYNRAEERRVEIMKANGFNAIRTSHNPPSTAFLDACDRLGMLVIDEAFDMWEKPKNPNDYSRFFKQDWKADLESMIYRDRNHPSVICWSIGNEIPERADTSGERIARKMRECILAIETSRPITAAICGFWDHPAWTWANSASAFKSLDIGGYNYQWKEYEPDHIKFPNRIMMGTESVPKEAFQNWQQVLKHSYVIGDFVWTGMDYLGETGIGHVSLSDKPDVFAKPWPWYDSWCGDIDICGFKKPQSYYRDVVWSRSNIEIEVHTPLKKSQTERVSFWGWPDEQPSWTWPGNEGEMMKINVYSRSESVKLFLNDKFLAEKTIPDTSNLTASFEIPYQMGTLKAIGISNGKETESKLLTTSGEMKTIRLIADRLKIKANRSDLAYITVEAVDEKGNLVPNSDAPVDAIVSGNGELLASGNASPDGMESFRRAAFKLYKGKGLIIVRPSTTPGNIEVRVVTGNSESAKINIATE